MKKIFVFFFIILIIFIFPCYAAVGGSFNNEDNLLQISSSSIAGADFIAYPGAPGVEGSFFKVNLTSDQLYSFIALNAPSDKLLISPLLHDGDDNIVYGYNSSNKIVLRDDVFYSGGLTFRSDHSDGSITISGSSGSTATIYYLTNYYIPVGNYYFKIFSDKSLNGSSFYGSFTNESTGVSGGDYGSGRSLVSNGDLFTFAFVVGPNQTLDNVKIYPGVYTELVSEFSIGYSEVLYSDNPSSLVSFNPGKYSSGDYLIGILDSSSAPSDSVFSRVTSDENPYFFIEGFYTLNDVSTDIYDSIYENSFNSGYDSGYSSGQTDGLNSSSVLGSIILTVFNAPFVFINNVLDFEIFGINLLNIVRVLITLLVLAFVVTKLKGRE